MNKIICILLLCLTASMAFAKTTLDLGVAGVGARPMGMGKAYVAVADDANTLFFNPAGLNLSKAWEITSLSTQLLQVVDYKHVAGVLPTKFGNVGVGYITLSSPAGYLTTDKNSLSGASEISYGSSELLLSYAREIAGVMAGANLKFVSNSFKDYSGSGSGYGLDFGLLRQVNQDVKIGASLQNIVANVSWGASKEDLPSILKLGISGKPLDGKLLFAVDADAALSVSRPLSLHAGLEYKPLEQIALRVGADQNPLSSEENTTNITAGVGLALNGFGFDYAYVQDGSIKSNSAHYFSVSISQPRPKTVVTVKEENLRPYEIKSQLDSSKLIGENDILKHYEKSNVVKATPKDILSYYKSAE